MNPLVHSWHKDAQIKVEGMLLSENMVRDVEREPMKVPDGMFGFGWQILTRIFQEVVSFIGTS